MKIPNKRPPSHPGEILLEDFLKPMQVSRRVLAEAIHVPDQHVSELINSKRSITPSTARLLSIFFGNSPGFWLNLQQVWELYHAMEYDEQ
ncbi:plasmid maintenance system antidote protein, XRE family (plasmid) [Thalassoporum mexicanum PCC 7367]|uniref:HigA family addiction module antitoxin n=1 Tax=Thalassoporum mexicanum TaxID=3457544 RepID=UPI00029FF547|nr:HigA family addiction module antitoxin [Pseudanabaena sp. PCC 7367]AFY71944.1 plasmid maintenance system antidote protein, XRE family [Pseudanabaena sp. PCC 7367]